MFRITNDGGRSKQDIYRELVGKTRCARRTIPLSEASRCAKNSHALHGICSCFGRLELHAAVQLRNAKKVFLWAKGLVCLDPTCNGPIVTTVQSVLASSNQSGETQGAGDAHVVIPMHLDRLWRLGVSRRVSMVVSTLVFPAGVPAAVQRAAAPPALRRHGAHTSGHCLVQTGRALPAAPMMVMLWPMSLGDAIPWADLGDIIP